jgi:hypothetical protein
LLHDVLYQDKEYEIAYLSNGSRPGEEYEIAYLSNGSRPGEGDEVLGWEACFRSVVSLDPLPQ